MTTPTFKGWYAGVGSRETPEDVLQLMQELSLELYSKGYALSSGDATGADRAFWKGATKSPYYRHLGARIYLSAAWVRGRAADPENYFYNALSYHTFGEAKDTAEIARGGWYGLNEWGVNLHTRNVFQILGSNLTEHVQFLIYWAKPIGKTEKVKGGTNTALQIAKRFGVKQRINLYTVEGRAWAENFLAKTEINKLDKG